MAIDWREVNNECNKVCVTCPNSEWCGRNLCLKHIIIIKQAISREIDSLDGDDICDLNVIDGMMKEIVIDKDKLKRRLGVEEK